ncbi:MAG: type II toxin-antitoxin system HicA family toxin [Cyanobacteria bacterium]|nr:type II toxin-antitoxin system HicA family toxin [Cyanobacteriota bacterium]
MAKLKTFSGKEICELLSQYGFVKVRQKGSHVMMQKRTDETTITIPVPNHKQLKSGTLSSIVRQSQLERLIFEVE